MTDEFVDEHLGEKCPNCKSWLIFTNTEKTSVHYGRLDCPQCRKWIKWVKNPVHEGERRCTSKSTVDEIMWHHKMKGEPFCFFCLRNKNQLGKHETLTLDHIRELNKGGEDKPENLQILCSACHKMKNWLRLYMNWHLKREKE